ncbi:hypothetical protein KUCAC02_002857 [Chaenocephalus aceratus]|uniref:Uncharacterized protein n=1 Tax=Chaenocephalus aceratus TaxID=36190 RepID=A0ACB9WIX8_CHAAC|nr:hypothetical protein KUCAC02_002857 [Chaenocephalus aceratus]
MYYKRIPIPNELQKNDPSEPFEVTVMAGGLFAVARKGSGNSEVTTTGLEIWGGEQYEISFKENIKHVTTSHRSVVSE